MNRSALAALVLASAALGACAWLPHLARIARARPIPAPMATSVVPGASEEDRLYQDAAQAIDQRAYGAALDLLAAARDRKPDDVRVINAFGVVYDKLGRFDLSGRYYAEAQALDPGSPIVAHNLAYSAFLQGKAHGSEATALALAAPKLAPAEGGGLVRVAPGVVRLELAQTAPASAPVITGHPLGLLDASGRKGVAEPVRTELARMGWTVSRAIESLPQTEARTVIVYAPQDRPAAQALARTLAHPVQLAACDDGCEGVRLILGADAAAWKSTGRHAGARRTL